MFSHINKNVTPKAGKWISNISLPTIAIIFTNIICLVLILQFSWKGIDGKNYTRVISSDGIGYYMYLPNFFLNKSISRQSVDNRFILESSGRGVNKYFVGTAVAMSPFFGIGYTIAYFQGDELDGYSPPFQKMISIAGLFYLILGLVFLSLLLSQYAIKPSVIAFTLLLTVFGTNLLTYAVTSPSMSHIYSWCFITSFLYFIKKLSRTKKSKYLYLGVLAFGLTVLIRPLNGIVILAIPFLAGSFSNFKDLIVLNSSIKKITFSSFILLALFSSQLYVWLLQSGDFFVWGYKK
jgi:hypothetical protein